MTINCVLFEQRLAYIESEVCKFFFMTEIQPNLPLTRNHNLDRAPYHNSGLIVVMMKEIMI